MRERERERKGGRRTRGMRARGLKGRRGGRGGGDWVGERKKKVRKIWCLTQSGERGRDAAAFVLL